MALIHEKLYRSQNLARIDFGQYIQDLSGYLLRVHNVNARGITPNIQADEVYLDIERAVPCGLIFNELVSNALKHAFPDGRTGEIQIKLVANDESQLTLIVADNGVGLPPKIDFRRPNSLGLQLVDTLVDQLDGTIELDRKNGTQFKIKFALL
jgi:two-component sensor histidine kinase